LSFSLKPKPGAVLALAPGGTRVQLFDEKERLFDKSRLPYGLEAKKGICEAGQAIIVEGYMDVMQGRQAGYTNIIAQMGTALTEAQLRQLKRYTGRLVLALDADAAGQKATLRGLEKQKHLLAQLLDKNQLYVHLSEIDDAQFNVSEEDQGLNKVFYGE